jgi:carboxymethylenebutenolidase
MIEQEVDVTAKYGKIPSFAVCPSEPGRFPGIILYMDAPGMREELRHMARRVAKQGYFCLVPDMYYRLGTLRFDIPRRDEAMSAVIRAARDSLTNAQVTDDSAGLIAFLDGQDKAAPGPVGCVGYCMSGRYVTTVAARFPERMAAAGSLYGTGIVTDNEDSPHRLADRIKAEMYYAFAEIDPAVPDNVIPDLTAALDKAGTRYAIETLPGTHHGFASPERKDYHHSAAEHTWTKLFELWDRNLK